jgi:NADH-ubiquinone oxidoreductase chain 2
MAKLTIFVFLLNVIEFAIPSNVLNYTLESADKVISKNLLLISSLLSLIIGTVAGLSQVKIKRLLAFSSVSHVGFLLLALAIYSINSIESFIFYLVQYSITSLNIFLIILAMGYLVASHRENKIPNKLGTKSIENKNSVYLDSSSVQDTDLNYLFELKGQFTNNYILGISLAVCLFSMAGIPPLMGFFGKQFVLYSSIENGNIFLSFVAIVVSVISASYYLKLVNYSFFSLPYPTILSKDNLALPLSNKLEENTMEISDNKKINDKTQGDSLFISLEISNTHSFIISLITLVIVLFFVHPTLILNGSSYMALTYFYI